MNLSALRVPLAVLSLVAAPAVLAAPATTRTSTTTTAEKRPVLLIQVGSTVAAAAIAAPASIWLGQWVSSWTGSDLGALPALLIAAVVPPVLVSLAGWMAGNWGGGPERFHLSPAIWIATGVNVVTLVAAGFLGFNASEPGQVALYTAADAVLLPAATVTALQWGAAPAQVSLAPQLPRVASVPVVRFQF